jgi:oligogalacturonide lyase
MKTLLIVAIAAAAFSINAAALSDSPTEWIEPATGHRVIQLTREPGSASLYFHQNMYTATGDKMVIATPRGLSTIDLKTREVKPLVDGRVADVVVGRKTRKVFYMKDGGVYETSVDTGATRLIMTRPELRSGSGLAVNADETLLAGSYVERENAPAAPPQPSNNALAAPPPTGDRLEARWAAHLPMALYTIEIASGKVKPFYRSTDWLNHVQFSATDPTLVMFCHEGPWHKVDRIWTIRTDGSARRLMHTRTMDMEIAGHEFFSADGKTIWYDLQTPKGKEFWLAGVNVDTGARVRYRVAREAWSVHYNASPDGKQFAGDGGGPHSVAAPGNGQWIYLFTPKDRELQAERLVDLNKHDYRLEPNVSFTPDGKWIVFRSNMSGASQVYAVEVRKAH